MAFFARSFIFDDTPSDKFELFIISNNSSGVVEAKGSGSVELYSQKVYRRVKPFLYGVQQTPVLEFELSFASFKPICAEKQALISKWLLGQQTYKKLRICQPDYQEVYFNCILTNPRFNCVGNFAYSMIVDVICDSPFAWEEPRIIKKTNITSQITFDINNTSDLNDYVLPICEFTLSNTSNGFEIKNNSLKYTNGNIETFSMTGLAPNEVITVDSDLGIIKSSLGINRYKNSSGTFFRMKPFMNNISIGDDLKEVKITYQNARRVSA